MGAPNVSAVIAAAGLSRRFSRETKKQFAALGGRPLVTWCLGAMERSAVVSDVVVAVPEDEIGRARELFSDFGFGKIRAVVAGGASRSESVRNGFSAVAPEAEVVLVHDAARPFVDGGTIRRVVDGCAETGACVCAVAVADTIKETDGSGRFVSRTVPRERLLRAQTPQAFAREVFVKICARADGGEVPATDEAASAEAAGVRVRVVEGDELNMKITTRADMELAELLARRRESGNV